MHVGSVFQRKIAKVPMCEVGRIASYFPLFRIQPVPVAKYNFLPVPNKPVPSPHLASSLSIGIFTVSTGAILLLLTCPAFWPFSLEGMKIRGHRLLGGR